MSRRPLTMTKQTANAVLVHSFAYQAIRLPKLRSCCCCCCRCCCCFCCCCWCTSASYLLFGLHESWPLQQLRKTVSSRKQVNRGLSQNTKKAAAAVVVVVNVESRHRENELLFFPNPGLKQEGGEGIILHSCLVGVCQDCNVLVKIAKLSKSPNCHKSCFTFAT